MEEFIGTLAGEGLDFTHPLWQFYFIENYGKGCALVTRIHQCYADGTALTGVLLALTGKTAAEIIATRADSQKPNMGLTNWRGTKPRKQDAGIAKNYLNEDEIKLLGLLVEQYLAFAETMAQQQTPMYMKDWISRLDNILQLNGRELLAHAGKISHEMALKKSSDEFEKYKSEQRKSEKEQSLKEIEEDIQKLKKKIGRSVHNK